MEHPPKTTGGFDTPPGPVFAGRFKQQPDTSESIAGYAAHDAAHDTDLARDSAGQLLPRYQFVQRPAGRLACGDLVMEPVLGPVRVASLTTGEGDDANPTLVHIAWSDDHGPCQPSGRYAGDRLFPVRAPHHSDLLRIRQGIDQATWKGREVSGSVVRLIAAHLHPGPKSALYSFAVNGRVFDDLYDELDQVSASHEAYRPLALVLARYCLNREDTGPVLGWGPQPQKPTRRPKPVPKTKPAAANQHRATSKPRPPLNAKRLPVTRLPMETTLNFIDAAFALGVTASGSELSALKARWLIEHCAGTAS
jgi:hypothetical protein